MVKCGVLFEVWTEFLSIVYTSGIQPGVREDIFLGVRRLYNMYNLHYVPTTLGVREQKRLNTTGLDELGL
jgi:hypothetical protein